MTTKWADGFEDSAAAGLGTDYSVSGTFTIGTGRRTSTSSLISSSSGCSLARNIGGTEATVFQSCAVKPITLSGGSPNRNFMQFNEGAVVHVSLVITASGAIAAYRGNSTTLLGTSSAFLTAGNWSWFQAKVLVHDTTGTVEIRDSSGNVLLALTGQDTRNAGTGYCDAVMIGISASTGNYGEFDDWHAWDTTGSICNTWTNDTRIDHKLPDGAGNSASFTPSAGSNYDCVNEANHNTTDYVESSTAGHKDSYAFGDISHAPPNIFAVLVTAVAQKDDAGARSLKGMVRSAGTDYSGTAVTLNQGSYSRVANIQETDPATAVAWTQTGVNAAEYGFENV